MSSIISRDVTEELQGNYKKDSHFAALCDHFASQEGEAEELTVEEVAKRSGIGYYAVLWSFKLLGELGCGQFTVGRKGYSSRIALSFPPQEIGRAAQGLGQASPVETSPVVPSQRGGLKVFIAPLRDNLSVKIEYPADMTAEDVERMCSFIKMLPHRPSQS
jgi:hypothetical protein